VSCQDPFTAWRLTRLARSSPRAERALRPHGRNWRAATLRGRFADSVTPCLIGTMCTAPSVIANGLPRSRFSVHDWFVYDLPAPLVAMTPLLFGDALMVHYCMSSAVSPSPPNLKPHKHTRTHARARAHTCTHSHSHSHSHAPYTIVSASAARRTHLNLRLREGESDRRVQRSAAAAMRPRIVGPYPIRSAAHPHARLPRISSARPVRELVRPNWSLVSGRAHRLNHRRGLSAPQRSQPRLSGAVA
jgi:hypothetical protein